MQHLSVYLEAKPLLEGQKVLALTFMHGSRRRMEERLGQLQVLGGQVDCSTIDSFAWRLVRRWQSLAAALGFADIAVDQYELVCDAAAALLGVREVCGWVAATFPILLVDEAQDLSSNRLRMIEAMSNRLEVFIAADEFQCLSETLRPNPACVWIGQVCVAEELRRPRRTDVVELLDAATAIRAGQAPVSGKLFKVQLTPKHQFAGAWLSGNLQWYCGGKSVAIITPSMAAFCKKALEWTTNNATKKGAGPYSIQREESEAKAAGNFIAGLALQTWNDIPTVLALLAAMGDSRTTRDVAEWMDIQRRARSKTIFSKEDVERAIEQSFTQRRRIKKSHEQGWRGMTVHGAKNREFDNVIVLWPAAIVGNDEQKRRLLYNAVTRAKERCLVLVQSKASLNQAPFI